MPYYTDPYGNAGNKAAIMSVADQYKNISGIQSPDIFANQVYQSALARQGSPWTEGSDFGGIRREIENAYLNQPTLANLRGGTQVDIASDPATAAWLKQTKQQAQTTADQVRAAGGGGFLGKNPLLSLGLLAAGVFTGGAALGAWGGLGLAAGEAGVGAGLAAGTGEALSTAGLASVGGDMALGGMAAGGAAAGGMEALGAMAAPLPGAPAAYGWTGASGMTAGELAGAGTAGSAGIGLSDVYKAYSQGKQVLGGVNALTGGGQASPQQQGARQPGSQQGGGMAGVGDLTLQNLSGLFGGVADYATTQSQQNKMNAAYGQAQNLILNPSAEQAQIRQKTMGMINDPSSFFQDPMYQAAFGQGQQALERSQASRQMAGSGGAAQELQKYGQTMASDQYTQRLQQLAGLSGISQDPAQRVLGANTLLAGAKGQALAQSSGIAGLGAGISKGLTGTSALGGTTLDQMMSGLGLAGGWLSNLAGYGGDSAGASQGLTSAGIMSGQTSGFSPAELAGWGGTDPNAVDPNSWNSLMNYSGGGGALDTSVNTWDSLGSSVGSFF